MLVSCFPTVLYPALDALVPYTVRSSQAKLQSVSLSMSWTVLESPGQGHLLKTTSKPGLLCFRFAGSAEQVLGLADICGINAGSGRSESVMVPHMPRRRVQMSF